MKGQCKGQRGSGKGEGMRKGKAGKTREGRSKEVVGEEEDWG